MTPAYKQEFRDLINGASVVVIAKSNGVFQPVSRNPDQLLARGWGVAATKQNASGYRVVLTRTGPKLSPPFSATSAMRLAEGSVRRLVANRSERDHD
jgi:hypothetical protein